jgi:hypothetical protein
MLSFRGAFRLNQFSPRRRKARSTKELRRITAFPEVRQKNFAALLAPYWGDF